MAVAGSRQRRKEACEALTFVMLRVLNPPAGMLIWSNASERNFARRYFNTEAGTLEDKGEHFGNN